MIVDFTATNYRSIKTEQLLSLYAEKKPKHHIGNVAYIEDDLGLLKTTAIYGANASGKTNLLLALDALKYLIVESGDLKENDAITAYEPYLLSRETLKQPTSFEIEFYTHNERYRYEVTFDRFNILHEKLDHFKTSKPSNIFTRTSPDEWKEVKFGDSYKGGKKQFAFFPNNSYISKAGNSPESPEFIRDIYNFFRKDIYVLKTNHSVGILDWENKHGFSKVVDTFLGKADFGINNFKFEKGDLPEGMELPEGIPNELREKFITQFSKKEMFYHKSDFGDLVAFDSSKESRGTNRLFKLIPFFTMVLKTGSIICVDEIEMSLHPHIAELVIKLFNDPLVNVNNAQLIFTTHDMSLMSQDTLRKDQVYLAAKSPEGGTEYVSLEEFEGSLKDSSPFAKWYNEGRLGGIPEINYRDIADSIKEVFNDA